MEEKRLTLEQVVEEINPKWYYPRSHSKFSELLGKTIVSIDGVEEDSDLILIQCSDGSAYVMYHMQDCCETVDVEDVCGDVSCLLNSPITMAEEVVHYCDDEDLPEDLAARTKDDYFESATWTFYKLATVKGYVTIRWYGESNGYYSERVDFSKIR